MAVLIYTYHEGIVGCTSRASAIKRAFQGQVINIDSSGGARYFLLEGGRETPGKFFSGGAFIYGYSEIGKKLHEKKRQVKNDKVKNINFG